VNFNGRVFMKESEASDRPAVGCIAWLGLFGRISDDSPSELLSEILETAITNPVVIAECGIALVQHIWMIFHHELRPAEGAMIMVPVGVRGITPIWTANKRRSSQVRLLSSKPSV